jgi:hypothetical protein
MSPAIVRGREMTAGEPPPPDPDQEIPGRELPIQDPDRLA